MQQGERLPGQDALQRLAVLFAEHGAQRFVARHQRLECGIQRSFVQLAAQVQAGRYVVGRRLRRQLPQQPKAVLRQRLRQGLPTVKASNGRRFATPLGEDCRHGSAVLRQGRCFEQGAQAQRDTQFIGQTRSHLGGSDGVAAQQQEVIIGGD
ncbi:hypothetical protein BR1R5_27060 [Pseudomonas sp. BR1R-5]|nr:hypothetical protein BR1R5_27060 [Pseudomonas sp. BR1R-5]